MTTEAAARLEVRGLAYQARYKKEAGRTWQSATIELPRGNAEAAAMPVEAKEAHFFRGLC